MMKDSIFRLASMSKPITAVAVMMMVEEGKIRLTDRVSAFIPEFKNMKVAVAKGTTNPVQMPAFGRGGPPAPPPEFDLVPAAREITVKDLLTHTSGLMSGGVSGAEQAKLAPRGPNDTLANYIPKLAQTPLDFQPGTLWRYSGLYGLDVLARIVEITSGQPYDQFLKQRLFDPLGMKDTGLRADARAHGARRDRLPADAERSGARAQREPADQRDVFLRVRRPDEHRRRLPAVRADARQRRHAERQTVPRAEDRRVDDVEPHRRHGERPVRPPRARDGLRPRRAGRARPGGGRSARVARHLRVGGRVRHEPEHGSEGKDGVHYHDAGRERTAAARLRKRDLAGDDRDRTEGHEGQALQDSWSRSVLPSW